jgi:hypothetical protein
MLKKFVGAAIVMVLVGGVALAETINGVISKIDKEKKELTITSFKKNDEGKFEKGDPKTIKYGTDTKVFKGKGFKKDAEPDDSTLDDLTTAVSKAAKGEGKMKGVFATVEVTDGKATKITFRAGFGRGKGKGKKEDKKDKDTN